MPPSWIVKLPGRENFKSSLRKSPRSKKDRGSTRRSKRSGGGPDQVDKEAYATSNGRAFVVKPIPMAGSRPIIVFINPKSGGNQGAKLMQKFQWLLNPRQVFDLTQGGPRAGYVIYLCLQVTQLSCLTLYKWCSHFSRANDMIHEHYTGFERKLQYKTSLAMILPKSTSS